MASMRLAAVKTAGGARSDLLSSADPGFFPAASFSPPRSLLEEDAGWDSARPATRKPGPSR